jgi:hypothetical protein
MLLLSYWPSCRRRRVADGIMYGQWNGREQKWQRGCCYLFWG